MTRRFLAASIGCGVLFAGTAAFAGDPVPGIDVSLEQIPGPTKIAQVQTDRYGRYQFPAVAPGSYCVRTAPISTSTVTLAPPRSANDTELRPVLVNFGVDPDGLRLTRISKVSIIARQATFSVTVGTTAQPTTSQPLTAAPAPVSNCFTIVGRSSQVVKGVIEISIKEESNT